jgi:hypothetical protein
MFLVRIERMTPDESFLDRPFALPVSFASAASSSSLSLACITLR